ncbi:MAG: peptidyl-prolyl cis-trans isomerase, partial [Fervidobacterium nodosum]
KALDEPKVAKQYLAKLKEIKPDYSLDFEKAEKELDEMIKNQEASQQSTNTTNEGTNTGK